MATPSTMILSALQMIGEKRVGGTLTAGEQTEYLQRLNSMLELWATEKLLCYASITTSHLLTAGLGNYTIGPAGTIVAARPMKIDSAYTVDGSNVSREIPNLVTDDEWSKLSLRQLGNMYPDTLFYEKTFPSGEINLWPLPLGGLTLFVVYRAQLQSFALITDTVSLPPGYEMAITTNLAINLAMGVAEPSRYLVQLAAESKSAIKKLNLEVPTLELPPGIDGDNSAFYQFPVPQW